jgi:hypothetical protein
MMDINAVLALDCFQSPINLNDSRVRINIAHALPNLPKDVYDRLSYEALLAIVYINGSKLACFPFKHRDTVSMVSTAVANKPYALAFASSRVRDNEAVVTLALHSQKQLLKESPTRYAFSPLKFASHRLSDTREIVELAIEIYPYALKYASVRLRSDKDIVSKAVDIEMDSFGCASYDLCNDKEFLLHLVQKYSSPLFLDHASFSLRDNEDCILQCIRNTRGLALQYASSRLTSDPKIVSEAICAGDVSLISHASHELFRQNDVVLDIIKSHPYAFEFLPSRSRDNEAIAMAALEGSDMDMYAFVGDTLKIFSHAVNHLMIQDDVTRFQHIYRSDPSSRFKCIFGDVAMLGCSYNGMYLEYCSDEVRDNPVVVEAALKENCSALCYASARIRADRDFLLGVMPHATEKFEDIMDAFGISKYEMASLDYQITEYGINRVLRCLVHSEHFMKSVSLELIADGEFVNESVKHFKTGLFYARTRLRNRLKTVLKAIRNPKGPCLFACIGQRLRNDPYIQKLWLDHWTLSKMPRFAKAFLLQHRQLKAANVAAQVDIWMIKNGYGLKGLEGMVSAKKQRVSE